MPRGGARPGAGRRKGSFEQLVQLKRASEMAQLYMHVEMPPDPVDFMLAVQNNSEVPLVLRIQCAQAAAPYVRARLNATASVIKHVDGDDAAFGRLFHQIEAKLALAAPERRAEVIDMLRDEE